VPDRFRERQWTRLPGGEAPKEFVERVARLLAGDPAFPAARPVPDKPSGAATAGRPASPKLKPALFAAAAVLAIAAAYFAVDRFASRERVAETASKPTAPAEMAARPAASEKSIAVLPFVNLSGDDKDSYLGDGISGEILSALSKLPGLRVIGRASSFQFRGRDVDAAKVGRELRVSSLLSGTVQRAGEDLRITVELVDTARGVQLWSERYDRKFKNLFALQDDIASAVSKALAVQLGANAGQPLVKVATTNPRAHDLYLRAQDLAFRSDEASLDKAVILFNQAIAEDPNYAAAWAGLSYAYLFLADSYRAPIGLLPAMKAAAEKAVALDANLAEAHAYLGYILASYQRDLPAARRAATRAIELKPGSGEAHMWLGVHWLQVQDPALALAQLQIARQLDPQFPWIPFVEMWARTATRDQDGALKAARRVLELVPDFSYFTDPLVYVHGSFGRWRECLDRAGELQKKFGRDPDYMVAVCHAKSGNEKEARRILAQMESASLARYVDHVNIAEVRVALGDRTGAFAALDQAYRDRSAILLNSWFLPGLEPLHGDPRFRGLMDRVYATLSPRPKQ
jgi:TolB-like protein